ncbi:MAG: IS1595 family transposase [Aeromonas sp.]
MTNTFYQDVIKRLINEEAREDAIVYLRNWGVLKTQVRCSSCNLILFEKTHKRNRDKLGFRCGTKLCIQEKKWISIRCNSKLAKYSISLQKIIHFLYLYANDYCQKQIKELVGLSESLICKMTKDLRYLAKTYLDNNPVILGGPGVIIQIDESKLNFNVKSHRGHAPIQPIWVFGIVDTRFFPAKGYMEIVPNRSRETLMTIIRRHISEGSIIHSDEWQAYANLNENGYEHTTVCHKHHFVNPENGTHTQHIESYWNRQKLKIKRSKGVYGTNLANVLAGFVFADLFRNNVFEAMLMHLLQ